jgi:ankyrin repeat protein
VWFVDAARRKVRLVFPASIGSILHLRRQRMHGVEKAWKTGNVSLEDVKSFCRHYCGKKLGAFVLDYASRSTERVKYVTKLLRENKAFREEELAHRRDAELRGKAEGLGLNVTLELGTLVMAPLQRVMRVSMLLERLIKCASKVAVESLEEAPAVESLEEAPAAESLEEAPAVTSLKKALTKCRKFTTEMNHVAGIREDFERLRAIASSLRGCTFPLDTPSRRLVASGRLELLSMPASRKLVEGLPPHGWTEAHLERRKVFFAICLDVVVLATDEEKGGLKFFKAYPYGPEATLQLEDLWQQHSSFQERYDGTAGRIVPSTRERVVVFTCGSGRFMCRVLSVDAHEGEDHEKYLLETFAALRAKWNSLGFAPELSHETRFQVQKLTRDVFSPVGTQAEAPVGSPQDAEDGRAAFEAAAGGDLSKLQERVEAIRSRHRVWAEFHVQQQLGCRFNGLASLHMACLLGRVDVVRFLVQTVAPEALVGATRGRISGWLPAHCVCLVRHSAEATNTMLDALQSRGAVLEVISQGEEGLAAPVICTACWHDNVHALSWILKHDQSAANKHQVGGLTALHLAVQRGAVDCIHVLLRAGADTTRRCDRGARAIFGAVGAGVVSVPVLLEFARHGVALSVKELTAARRFVSDQLLRASLALVNEAVLKLAGADGADEEDAPDGSTLLNALVGTTSKDIDNGNNNNV